MRRGAAGPATAFVCCDLGPADGSGGSGTAVAGDVGPAALALVRDAIAATGGDEVPHAGAGVMAAFSRGMASAVAAAVTAQRAMARLAREHDQVPALRVGVAAGPAERSREDRRWTGPGVTLASRLCAAAAPGQVLWAPGSTAALAGAGAMGLRTAPAGLLDLPDVAGRVEAWELAGNDDDRARALPLELVVPEVVPFVGRAATLADLEAALSAGRPPRGAMVTGEPGTGKTRLAREVAARRMAAGAPAAWFGRCRPGQAPTAPLADALRAWASAQPRAALAALLDEHGSAMAVLLAHLSRTLPPPTGQGDPDPPALAGALGALARFAVRYPTATDQPVVLVIDDLHHAHPTLLEVLAAVVRSPSAPIAVLGVARENGPQWPAGLERLGLPHRRLGGLPTDDAVALVGQGVGDGATPTGAVVAVLAERTGGNPRDLLDLVAQAAGMTDPAAARLLADQACPYPGLRPYQPEDHPRFAGRGALVRELVERVAADRVVGVVGPCGSGASSLVRAGLVPAVAHGALDGSDRWLVAVTTPGPAPFRALAAAIAGLPTVADPAPVVEAELRRGADSLDRLARRLLPDPGQRLVLVVDQFEELFTQCPDGDRARFIDLLAAAGAAPGGPVSLVAVLRADVSGHLGDHPLVAAALAASPVLVGAMTPEELADAVREPAFVAGFDLDDGLVARVVADAADLAGSLPLVSHALRETWRRRTGRRLTVDAYEAAGGVHDAVARTAERVYGAGTADEQDAIRQLLVGLVVPGGSAGDTRRRVALAGLPPPLAAVVPHLVEAGLLTTDGDTVQLAHEAVIRAWPRLQAWLDAERAGQGRPDGAPLPAAPASTADRWVSRFTAARHRRPSHRRARPAPALRAAGVVVVAFAVVVAAVALARRVADPDRAGGAGPGLAVAGTEITRDPSGTVAPAEAARIDAELGRVAAEARTVAATRADLGMLLAVEVARRRPSADSHSALVATLLAQPAVDRFVDLGLADDDRVVAVAGTAPGPLVALTDTEALVVDGESLRPTGVRWPVAGAAGAVVRADGAEVAVVTGTGTVERRDPATGAAIAPTLTVRPGPAPGPATAPPIAYLVDGTLAVADGSDVVLVPPGAAEPARRLPLGFPVTVLTASPTGTALMASGTTSGTEPSVLVDPVTGAVRAIGPASLTARFLPGDRIALATLSGVRIVDPVTGAVVASQPATAPTVSVRLLALPDGSIADNSTTAELRIWQPDLSEATFVLQDIPVVLGPALADGGLLVATGARLAVIDPDRVPRPVTALALTGNVFPPRFTDRIVVAGPDGARLVDAARGEPVGPPIPALAGASPGRVDLGPDGVTIIGTTGAEVRVFDGRTGQQLADPFPAAPGAFASLSPDGSRLAIVTAGRLQVIGLPARTPLLDQVLPDNRLVLDVVWRPDGRELAVSRLGRPGLVVDVGTGASRELDGQFAAYSPDGGTRASASLGEPIRVSATDSGAASTPITGAREPALIRFADRNRLVRVLISTNDVDVVDLSTGSPIGGALLSGSLGADPFADSVAIAVDGRSMLVGRRSGDRPVLRVELDPARWIDLACAAAGRNLTRAEWDRHLGAVGPYRATCPQYPAGS